MKCAVLTGLAFEQQKQYYERKEAETSKIRCECFFFSLLKFWVTQNFITIKTSWNTND
jgi:hypothetical protein